MAKDVLHSQILRQVRACGTGCCADVERTSRQIRDFAKKNLSFMIGKVVGGAREAHDVNLITQLDRGALDIVVLELSTTSTLRSRDHEQDLARVCRFFQNV